jgi:hypothetical protein
MKKDTILPDIGQFPADRRKIPNLCHRAFGRDMEIQCLRSAGRPRETMLNIPRAAAFAHAAPQRQQSLADRNGPTVALTTKRTESGDLLRSAATAT